MFAGPDNDLLLRAIMGTESVEGNPDDVQPDAPEGRTYPDGFNPGEDVARHRIFQPFDLTIVAGASQVFDCQLEPAYWILALNDDAGTKASIFVASSASGPGIRLGPGGDAKLPGRGSDITVVNTGSTTIAGTLIAVRGLDVQVHFSS